METVYFSTALCPNRNPKSYVKRVQGIWKIWFKNAGIQKEIVEELCIH
jgi:hypothetical protein